MQILILAYQIDVYKIELWKLIKAVLRLLDCDVQNLEEQIIPIMIEDDAQVHEQIIHRFLLCPFRIP